MKDFVELTEYPGYYIAHSPARLCRVKGDILIECSQTPNSKKDNYWTVTLKNKKGKYVKRSMHRLLMQTFVPNPKQKAHVNHKDGDKSNLEIDNMEWATPKENVDHAHRTGLIGIDYKIKPIHQYNMQGEYLASYDTDTLAEEATHIPKQNISKASLGKRVHAGYFRWSRNKYPSLPPVKKKYIANYYYKGRIFNSIAAIAKWTGCSHPDKRTIKTLPNYISKEVNPIYYE